MFITEHTGNCVFILEHTGVQQELQCVEYSDYTYTNSMSLRSQVHDGIWEVLDSVYQIITVLAGTSLTKCLDNSGKLTNCGIKDFSLPMSNLSLFLNKH